MRHVRLEGESRKRFRHAARNRLPASFCWWVRGVPDLEVAAEAQKRDVARQSGGGTQFGVTGDARRHPSPHPSRCPGTCAAGPWLPSASRRSFRGVAPHGTGEHQQTTDAGCLVSVSLPRTAIAARRDAARAQTCGPLTSRIEMEVLKHRDWPLLRENCRDPPPPPTSRRHFGILIHFFLHSPL